jgi:para-aminobenzoate synthetase/4-amino-4-deoxychorismate lyase
VSQFEVAFGVDPARRFRHPHSVVRTTDADGAAVAFAAADAALRDGYWIAGVLEYEGGVTLGVFDPPAEETEDEAPEASFAVASLGATFAHYRDAIGRIAKAIYEGDVYQVNYTVKYDLLFDGDPYALYRSLATRTRAPYAAYVRDGDRHVLSFSPELFLGFENGRIATKPMKGTAPLDRVRDLESPKNRAEHLMIVDLLRNDLHRICTDVRVDRIFEVERHPTFATMTSTISGAIAADVPLAKIFAATFPCGSVTGAPKRAAMRQIAALEGRARGAYCGSVGFLSPERRGWWNVAIRTAQLDTGRGTGRFDAGGGIVADSRADDELAEVMLKARFFTDICATVDPLETFAGGDPAARDAHLSRLDGALAHFGRDVDTPRLLEEIAEVDRDGALVRVRVDQAGAHVETRPLVTPAEPVALCISPERVRSDDPMLCWKTTWRPHYDRAAAYAATHDCFDALLANERGELTEGARTTLFARIDGALATPPLASGLLPGILRARMLASGEATERTLTPDDLRSASEIFVGNSARGMLRARLVEP